MQTGEVMRRVVFNLLDAAKGGRLKKLKEVNNNLAELENSIRQQNIHITDTYGPYLGKEYLDTDKLMELSRIIQAGTASNITEAIEMDKNGEGKPEKN